MLYEALEFILEETYQKYSIPIIIFDKQKKIILPRNLKASKDDLNLSFTEYLLPNKISIIKKNEFYFSIFEDCTSKEDNYIILIGPYSIINSNIDLLQKNKEKTKFAKKEFVRFTKLIFSLLINKLPSEEQFVEINCDKISLSLKQREKENFDTRINKDAQLDSIELEKRLIESIIRNDLKTFEWLFNQMHKSYFSRIHSDRLTSLKYKHIGLVTIFTRVSINNGVAPLKAYSLSDSLIQGLESINSLQECIVYIRESCLQFMKLINSYKTTDSNPLIKNIIEYINTHINKKITVSDIALHCNKHSSYISSEFRKYMGLTLHNYINKKKIDEAKHFLIFTDLSSAEISSNLGFSDQSHFIKIFKQIESITPVEFRKKYQSTKLL